MGGPDWKGRPLDQLSIRGGEEAAQPFGQGDVARVGERDVEPERPRPLAELDDSRSAES
jgi:hypothetical protein